MTNGAYSCNVARVRDSMCHTMNLWVAKTCCFLGLLLLGCVVEQFAVIVTKYDRAAATVICLRGT